MISWATMSTGLSLTMVACSRPTTSAVDLAGAIAGVGADPAQVVQVEQDESLAGRLEEVGDLRGDRTLARPVHAGDQDAFGLAHQPGLFGSTPQAGVGRLAG
jgi:hypothetical protein